MIKKYKYNIEEFKLITCMADFFQRCGGFVLRHEPTPRLAAGRLYE